MFLYGCDVAYLNKYCGKYFMEAYKMRHSKLFKISIQYWLQHKRRLLTFMFVIIIGTIALYSSGMLVRSNKQAILDEELRILGNYDMILYSISEQDSSEISSKDYISSYGQYHEIGYVRSLNGADSNAAYFDNNNSENLYYLTCTKGHYPQKNNEVAIDITTAKTLGIKPYPGEKIQLQLYFDDDSKIIENEYTVCGVFDAINQTVYGGWYRYPPSMNIDQVRMPGIFFYKDIDDICDSSTVTAFFQTDQTNLDEIKNNINSEYKSINQNQISIPSGRRYAYTYVLGISELVYQKYGDNSLNTIFKAIKNGDCIKDFYSAVLMPVFAILIAIIVLLSIISMTSNILKDKHENFAILRCLGFEKKQLVYYVIFDFTFITVLFIIIGVLIGKLVHIVMIKALNSLYELNLHNGFSCNDLVKNVTFNPLVLSVIIVLSCVELSVAISLIKDSKLTPIKLLNTSHKKKSPLKGKNEFIIDNWKKLVSERINFCNHTVVFISIIVMGVTVFGYTYFHALADRNNVEYEYEKEQYGLSDWDYKAEKSKQSYMYTFDLENHHDYGVDYTCYQELLEQPFVKDCFAKISNNSTRLSFDKNNNEELLLKLENYNSRQYKNINEDNALEVALRDAENAMITEIGYKDDEQIYSIPTVGICDEYLMKLNSYLVDGQINLEKLNSGEEVILALSEREYESIGSMFKVGDRVPLSDVIFNSEEESIDFGIFQPSEIKEPVFKKVVNTSEADNIPVTSYAFGKRYDIKTNIGAIIVLNEEIISQKLFTPSNNYKGINLLCSIKEFSSWGLPDKKLTDLMLKVDTEYSLNKIDSYWYNLLSDSKGITVASTAEITNCMNAGISKTMSVYFCMVIVLITLAIITISISLYSSIRMKSNSFAVLRSCGMSIQQVSHMIFLKNLFYPIIGVLFAIIPTAICQHFFNYIKHKVDSGEWNSMQSNEIPWYHYIPFRYNLYEYNIIKILIIIFGLYVFIIIMITAIQMRLLSKQSITAELEKSSF